MESTFCLTSQLLQEDGCRDVSGEAAQRRIWAKDPEKWNSKVREGGANEILALRQRKGVTQGRNIVTMVVQGVQSLPLTQHDGQLKTCDGGLNMISDGSERPPQTENGRPTEASECTPYDGH
jgi:hypothetical protein